MRFCKILLIKRQYFTNRSTNIKWLEKDFKLDKNEIIDFLRRLVQKEIISFKGANIDFDYGDEDILARHGRVRRQELRVARAGYTTVLVPPSVTMRSSTLKLLKKFRAGGGRVRLRLVI